MNAAELLIALLRTQVCGGENDKALQPLSTETIEKLYKLSNAHDLAHIVGQGLGKYDVPDTDENVQKFKQQSMQAVFRYVQLSYEYERICDALEAAKVPFLPLKGSVLRNYYPEPWMRTSCDIDVLVKPEDLDRAISALTEKLEYRLGQKLFYDVSLYSAAGVHVELHFDVLEEQADKKVRSVLETIWKDAKPRQEGAYHHCLSDEMFYFYHIEHMSKHFSNGGCGVRPFLDLWILNHQIPHDRNAREKLLADGGLLRFAKAAENLSEAWFSGMEKDDLSTWLEQYVLTGGVYGTLQNKVSVQQVQQGGKLGYIFAKIFLPYDIIKYYYPVLQKHKWLLPVYQVRRWFRLVFRGGAGRSLRTVEATASLSKDDHLYIEQRLKQIGLR